jgi:hypothetical protein
MLKDKKQSCAKAWGQLAKAQKIREEIQNKRAIISDILENWREYPQFQKSLTYKMIMEMDTQQLMSIIAQLKLDIKMQKSAIIIQKNFRMFRVYKQLHRVLSRRHECALKIQRQWKVHRKRQF